MGVDMVVAVQVQENATMAQMMSTADGPKSAVKVPVVESGLESVKGSAEKVFTVVTGTVMHVYGKVGDTVIYMQVQLSDGSLAVKTTVLEAFQRVRFAVEACQGRVVDNVIVVKAKVTDTKMIVSARVVSATNFIKAKALDNYTRATTAASNIPAPIAVKNACGYVQTKVGIATVFVNDCYLHMYMKVNGSMMHVRIKVQQASDLATASVRAILNRAQQAGAAFAAKMNEGYMTLKGRVGAAIVSIKSHSMRARSSTNAKVTGAFLAVKRAVNDLPLTAKIVDGFTVVKGKTDQVYIYVKDGYIHAVSKCCDRVVYVRALAIAGSDGTRVKIVETYVGTKTLLVSIANQLMEQAAAVVDGAKLRASVVAQSSQVLAAQKPSATGAVLLGTGAGAAGLAVGGVAGAVSGLPLAIFTFGLSVPVGAVMGGGVGASVCAVAGGAAGAIGGRFTSYGYEHRDDIKSGVVGTINSVKEKGHSVSTRVAGVVKRDSSHWAASLPAVAVAVA